MIEARARLMTPEVIAAELADTAGIANFSTTGRFFQPKPPKMRLFLLETLVKKRPNDAKYAAGFSQEVAKSKLLQTALASHSAWQAATEGLFSEAIHTQPPPTFLMSQPAGCLRTV